MKVEDMQEVIIKIIEELKNASYFTESTFDEDGFINDDSEEVVRLSDANEIVYDAVSEYNNGWIPCSVELPPQPEENPIFEYKPLELYLVSVKGADYPIRAFWNGKIFTDGFSKLDADAWQPLPEPYRPCVNSDCVYNSGNECPASEGCAGYQKKGVQL